MSYNNPTYLHTGRSGAYGGRTWKVVGRVVLGVNQDGDIYYWNEFNLEAATGEVATLVFERTERGSEWRWFTQFEPEYPITAEDAATKDVGDILNLDGTDVRVSLLETSRIYFIDGRAPEGEKLDSVASYFNAENGDEMLVVSWTGPEVECYRGRTITEREVKMAFHLERAERTTVPAGALTRYNRVEPAGFSAIGGAQKVVLAAVIVFAVMILINILSSAGRTRGSTATGITYFSTPLSLLKLGATGQLNGENYHITGHARMTIAEVDLRGDQQHYFLRDDQNGEALLISGFLPGKPDWLLFTPLHPAYPMTPCDAAAMKLGQVVHVDGLVAPVDELFSTMVAESEFTDTPEIVTGETCYGFAAKSGSDYLLTRWNAGTISFWKGRVLATQTVLAAFKP
jgi:hypothetical protein